MHTQHNPSAMERQQAHWARRSAQSACRTGSITNILLPSQASLTAPCLFPPTPSSTDPPPPGASHRVEEVSYACCSQAHVHLNELTGAAADERHATLTSNSTSHQRLAVTWEGWGRKRCHGSVMALYMTLSYMSIMHHQGKACQLF